MPCSILVTVDRCGVSDVIPSVCATLMLVTVGRCDGEASMLLDCEIGFLLTFTRFPVARLTDGTFTAIRLGLESSSFNVSVCGCGCSTSSGFCGRLLSMSMCESSGRCDLVAGWTVGCWITGLGLDTGAKMILTVFFVVGAGNVIVLLTRSNAISACTNNESAMQHPNLCFPENQVVRWSMKAIESPWPRAFQCL